MDHRESPVSGVPPAVPDVDVQDNTSSPDDDVSPASPGSHPTVPSLRPTPDTPGGITASSTHLGQINAARRGAPAPLRPHASMSAQPSGLNPDILAKMKAFSLSRQGAPPGLPHSVSTGEVPKSTQESVSGAPNPGQSPTGSLAGPPGGNPPARPAPMKVPSSPARPGGLAEKRRKPGLKLSDASGPNGPDGAAPAGGGAGESAFTKYSDLIDAKAGTLNFKDKALIHGGGIQFSSGHNFNISLDEVDRLDELGKGNYGTVYKVRHSRPHMRKPGLGLGGIVSRSSADNVHSETSTTKPHDIYSGVVMAMKEIRLELDESKFSQIIMELDILHRCVSPFIIDFYGAFFQEGAVYICIEYMDGGSIDKLYKEGVPESILRKVTLSTIMGLRSLKDEHNIIHRDVKPTNFLVNTRGQIKICDFGVSGNLVSSIAKTNIGCQSYMAPERIAGGGSQQPAGGGGTYSVQSDVWSLGLSIVECAIGRYPYPPETFTNIFSQLHAIVHGEAPKLPESTYSKEAHAFVRACLDKNPNKRPSYNMLLRHPWLSPLMRPPQESQESSQTSDGAESPVTDDPEIADWVKSKIERCERGLLGNGDKPALHAVALDAVPGSPLLDDPTVSFPQP